MSSSQKSRILYMLAGSLLVLLGYVVGSMTETTASYAQSGAGQADRIGMAVSVPEGGFALFQANTGSGPAHWYVVDTNAVAKQVTAGGQVLYPPR
jgi:hypothetical protein